MYWNLTWWLLIAKSPTIYPTQVYGTVEFMYNSYETT